MLPAQQAAFARKYYENNWSDLENHDAEVELTTDGVIWRHNGDKGSYAWKNIRSIQETDFSIVFVARMTSIIAMKSGFKSDADLEEFRSFANAHMASN